MPFDIIGWNEAAPGTGTVGLTRAVNDQLYKRGTGDDIFILKKVAYIIGVTYMAESTPGYIQISQPGRAIDIKLLAGSDINTDPTPGYHHFFENPIKITPGAIMTMESNNATDEDTLVGVMLADGALRNVKVSPDEIIRGVGDQALTALTWTGVSITWSDTLPPGKYAIVKCRIGCYKASGYGGGIARLTGLDDANWRPGVPLELATGDKVTMVSSTSGVPVWSEWGIHRGISFEHDDMPDIEVLSPFANTDHVVELSVKKIG